jgi:hypothetical protein
MDQASTVADLEAGCCLGPEGNGVSVGEGDEGGPGPPRGGKDKQSVSTRVGAIGARTMRTKQVRRDEE